uniref:Uncharacterized protein n=1 Tax=Manihot esculenta TaxID=3983 RepID=A0A2C9WIU0_MANES
MSLSLKLVIILDSNLAFIIGCRFYPSILTNTVNTQ